MTKTTDSGFERHDAIEHMAEDRLARDRDERLGFAPRLRAKPRPVPGGGNDHMHRFLLVSREYPR